MVPIKTSPVLIVILTLLQLPIYIVCHGIDSKTCEFLNSTMVSFTKRGLISAEMEGLPLDLGVSRLDQNNITTIENHTFWVSLIV